MTLWPQLECNPATVRVLSTAVSQWCFASVHFHINMYVLLLTVLLFIICVTVMPQGFTRNQVPVVPGVTRSKRQTLFCTASELNTP